MDKREKDEKNIQKAAESPGQAGNSFLMTDSSILRYNDFLKEVGGERELAAELYDSFAADSLRRLDNAEQALAERDLERLRLEAHTLKGGALNLMADDMAHAAFLLEKSAKTGLAGNGNGEGGGDLLADVSLKKLAGELSHLKAAFKRFNEEWKLIRENNETD